MGSRADSIERLLDDHPSLAGSLEDFEADRSGHFTNASVHSISRSEHSEAESDRSSAPWSPPAWHQHSGGTWYDRARSAPASTSKTLAPSKSPTYGSGYEEDVDNTILPYPANIPLPPSPEKETPLPSAGQSPEVGATHAGAESTPREAQHVNYEDEKDDATPTPEGGNCMLHFSVNSES